MFVTEMMKTDLVAVNPETKIAEAKQLMEQGNFRHLPVLEGEKALGVLSIGDLVNWTITAQSQEIDQLKTFITGQYPG